MELRLRTYADYVHRHIFDPLGMTQTAILPDRSDNPGVAAKRTQIAGHTINNGHPVVADQESATVPMYPAGAATGTAGDLARFMTALMDPAAPLFAKPATQTTMESTSYWIGSRDTILAPVNAHGFWESEYAVRTIWHDGGTVAFSTNLVFAPETGFGAVVMTNQMVESKFCGDLIADLFGSPKPPTYVGDMPDAHDLAGWYTPSRRAFTGFPSQAMQSFVVFAAKDANTLTIPGIDGEYVQIAPYTFQLKQANGDLVPTIIYFEVKDGTVRQIRSAADDLLPATTSDIVIAYGGWVIIAMAVVYALAGGVLMVIGTVARARRHVKAQPAQRLNRALVIALIVVIANNITLTLRAFAMAPYADLVVHFIVNGAFTLFALATTVLLLSRLPGTATRTKVFAVFSAVVSLLAVVLLIMWQVFS